MVGSSDEQGYLPTSRQALDLTPLLFPMILLTILLTSLTAAGTVSAQESAACDQYECAEESAACDQYGCTDDPTPEDPAPVGRTASTGAGTPAVEPAPLAEDITPADENVGVVVPPSPAVYQGVEEDAPANGQYAEEEITPPPSEPNPITSEAEPVETEGKAAPLSKSAGQSTAAEGSSNEGGNDDGDESDENTEEPLPGYHYEGKPCEESNCGLKDIEAPIKCVTYETASGKEVYGCGNPKTYGKKGCYEVTFYTEDGKPYSNLDTCSGEKPYAPPEPPEGDFNYWEPPDNHGKWDPHDFWNGVDREEDLCRNDNGDVEWHCGLDVPKTWNCGVFYDTIHGTVRGCFDQKDYVHGACYDVHVYDEVGALLGIYQNCFKPQEGLCGEDQCGMVRQVPARWECSRVEHTYWGELYGFDSRVAIWCKDPILVKRLSSGRWSDRRKPCAIIFDEEGQSIQRMPCTPQGNSHIGRKAGKDAKDADNTLNGQDEPTSLAGGSSSPDIGAWGSDSFGGEQAPEAQSSPVSDAVSSNSSLSGGGQPYPIDLSDPSVATLEHDAVGSSAVPGSSSAGSQSADSGLPDEGTRRGANLIPDSAGSKTSDPGSDSVSGASHISPAHEANLLETERRTLEESTGRANNDPNTPGPDGNVSSDANDSGQRDVTKDVRWPEIVHRIGEAVASFSRANGVGGWLGTVTPLAGLGAVAGVFALRRRFWR